MRLTIVILLSVIISVLSERLKCTVVPFETREGLTGTCCVFFNKTIKNFPKEEVAKHILEEHKTDKQHDDKVVFEEKAPPPGRTEVKGEKEKMGNVTTANRNAFDTPEMCADGKLKDHNGDCTEPF